MVQAPTELSGVVLNLVFFFFNGLGVEDFGSGLGFSIFTQQYSWTFLDTDGAVLF